MDLRQVDQTVVTTEPAVPGLGPPDALWAPEAPPAAPAVAAPLALPSAPVSTAPVAPAVRVWYAPIGSPVAVAAPAWAPPVAQLVSSPVAPAVQQVVQTFRRSTTRTSQDNAELTRRIVVLVFGLIELFIGMRVVLLLLDARTTNGLVSGIMSLSGPFVAPFEGILRTNSVSSSGSILDVAALLALAGWAVVETVVLWILATFRREPA
jgi:hypothetical protein